MQASAGPVRHIVIFKYRQGVDDERIREVTDAFRLLQHAIPGIQSFEQGVNNSKEGKSLGFEYVYTLTFESIEARDNYLPHPAHQEFVAMLQQTKVLEDAFIVDYIPAP